MTFLAAFKTIKCTPIIKRRKHVAFDPSCRPNSRGNIRGTSKKAALKSTTGACALNRETSKSVNIFSNKIFKVSVHQWKHVGYLKHAMKDEREIYS